MKELPKPDEMPTIYKPGDELPSNELGAFAICIFTGASHDQVGGLSRYTYYLDTKNGNPRIFRTLHEACKKCDKLEDEIVCDTSYGPAHLRSYSVSRI